MTITAYNIIEITTTIALLIFPSGSDFAIELRIKAVTIAMKAAIVKKMYVMIIRYL